MTAGKYAADDQPVVYRVFDEAGRLIYIGASRALAGRLSIHQDGSWWFELIGEVTSVPYPTMAAAFAAERVAIQEEQPAFNIAHTTAGPVLTEADARVALRWRRKSGHYFRSLTLIDRLNEFRAAGISNAA